MSQRTRRKAQPVGSLNVLSVGRGDLKLVVSRRSPRELADARQVITDMLHKGYAIFVELEKGQPMERVTAFDPDRLEYIIELPPAAADQPAAQPAPLEAAEGAQATSGPPMKPKRGRRQRVPADGASAIAVGRTAGG